MIWNKQQVRKQRIRDALTTWWGDTFITDYVIDQSGNYKSQADCIEELVIRIYQEEIL
jgi:hypothetical protein